MKRTDSDQRPPYCAIYRPYRFLVQDGNVRLKDESLPFGEVTSGYLTVSAVMKTVRKGYFRDVKLRDPRMPWFVAEPHWDFGEEIGLEDKEYHLLAIW
jgi:hypothetical protein